MKYLLRLMNLFNPYKKWILLGIIISLISTLATICLMSASGWFISAMGLAGIAGITMNYFTPAAIIRACSILRTGGRYAERLITHEATFRLIALIRVWFYKNFQSLSPTDFAKNTRSGDIMSRLKGDIDTLERFYLGFLVPAFVSLLAIIVILIASIFYNKNLTIILVIFLVTGALIIPIFSYIKSKSFEQNQVDLEAKMRTEFSENFQGMAEILIYDKFETKITKLERINEKYQNNQNKIALITAISNNILLSITGFSLILVLLISIPLIKSSISPTDLALLALFTIASFEAISPMSQAFQGLGAVQRAAKRIFEISDKKSLIKTIKNPKKISNIFPINFKDVDFSYEDNQNKALKKVNFSLNKNEKLAIIGPIGAGKSSIINLLLRFWEINSGSITMNNVKISDLDLNYIRQEFAVLPQKPYIFADTIYNNLIFANIKATQQDIEICCKQAGIYDFIQSLPNKFNTHIGENGSTLSGGQIKRLSLARALLKKSSCLILDEPAEGLDYAMEKDILDRVIKNLNGKSLILITHRTANLSQMDKVIRIENGKINNLIDL